MSRTDRFRGHKKPGQLDGPGEQSLCWRSSVRQKLLAVQDRDREPYREPESAPRMLATIGVFVADIIGLSPFRLDFEVR